MRKNNNSIINVDLDNKYEYISKYDNNRISDELHDYIINRAMELDDRKKIIIKIGFNYDCNSDELVQIRKMLKNDFKESLNNIGVKRKRDNYKDFYLMLIGISCIVISIMFNWLDVEVVSEVFMIVGWVAIWEVVDTVLFGSAKDKLIKRKYIQLLEAKIEIK